MDLAGRLQYCRSKDIRRLARWLGLKDRSFKAVERFLNEQEAKRSTWPPPAYERKW